MTWKRPYHERLQDWRDAQRCAEVGDYRGWALAHLKSRQKYRGMVINLPSDVDCGLLFRIYRDCPDGYEIDHIVPMPKGEHRPENLQYLRPNVNAKKARKTVFRYGPGQRIRWQDVVR